MNAGLRVGATDFDAWRTEARRLLLAGIPPEAVDWSDASHPTLPLEPAAVPAGRPAAPPPARVPRELLRLLESVAQYRDPARWTLMYRLLWRVAVQGRALLDDAADDDLRRARDMAKAVRRDLHKMHAFVRFRAVTGEAGEVRYVAWFEPGHLTLRAGARFFARRFGDMHWLIATPDGAASWDQRELTFHSSPPRDALPGADPLEASWRAYYRSICNGARLRPRAMQREMPTRYWKHLPEAAEIGELLRESPRRVAEFDDRARRAGASHAPIRSSGPARPMEPVSGPVDARQLDACRACELWERATQAVAGEGPRDARLVLVGEQPGDEEDLQGRPFTGPAGRLLDALLAEAGLDRRALYLTNAVKHFGWEPRGKRRLHKTPAQRMVAACRPWLLQELAQVRPAVIVALGATALGAMGVRGLAVSAARGAALRLAAGGVLVATWHPSALLRAEGGEAARLRAELIEDLARAARLAAAAALTPTAAT